MAVSKVLYKIDRYNEKNLEYTIHIPPKGWGIRHLQTFLIFLCVVMGYSVRSQLSVLMVAMVDNSDNYNCNETEKEVQVNITSFNNHEECGKLQNISGWSVYQTYDWNKATQEIITFSFFMGYMTMQLPMSLLVQKFGGKIPIIIGLAVNGILALCTPWILLVGGWVSASVCRILQGMTQAALDPSVLTMLAKWTPPSERGRMIAYAFSGCPMGTIIAFVLSGLLASNPLFGWPASFWLFGILSLVICTMFAWFGAASPSEYPRMSTEELVYILEDYNTDLLPKKCSGTPWKKMLKCPSVWGIMTAQAGYGAFILLILTEIPLYMSNVLGVDIKSSGLYSSLPFIAMYFTSMLYGYLADFARNRQIMQIVNIRRTANTIGSLVSGIFLLAFSFVNNTLLAVCLLILVLGTASAVQVGFLVNQIDLAPNFAGSIMALGNMCGNLTSLLVPVVVSNVITDVTNRSQWQIVFFIFIGFQFLCNAIFVILAKAEVQPWNSYNQEENDPEDKKLSEVEKKMMLKEKEILLSKKNNSDDAKKGQK